MAKNVKIRIALSGAKKASKGLGLVASGLTSIGSKAALVSAKLGLAGGAFAVLSTKLAGDFQKNLFEVRTAVLSTGASKRAPASAGI